MDSAWDGMTIVHNGEIFEVEKVRRDLLLGVSPDYFSAILGTTDSELLFYLALTFGLESDPIGALRRMAGFVEQAGRAKGITESLWMTLGLSDGKTVYAVRYASDGNAPSLYYTPDVKVFFEISAYAREKFDQTARAIVSEPVGDHQSVFLPVPQGCWLKLAQGNVIVEPFVPILPGT